MIGFNKSPGLLLNGIENYQYKEAFQMKISSKYGRPLQALPDQILPIPPGYKLAHGSLLNFKKTSCRACSI